MGRYRVTETHDFAHEGIRIVRYVAGRTYEITDAEWARVFTEHGWAEREEPKPAPEPVAEPVGEPNADPAGNPDPEVAEGEEKPDPAGEPDDGPGDEPDTPAGATG